jgi:hypothetical protein
MFSGAACVLVVLHHSPFTPVRSEVVKRLNRLWLFVHFFGLVLWNNGDYLTKKNDKNTEIEEGFMCLNFVIAYSLCDT